MTCAYCLAPLEFKSLHSTQNICATCYPMTESDSPIQINSTGEIHSRSFKIIGCKKRIGTNISWLDWLVVFEDTGIGWIKESQGTWIFFRFDSPFELGLSFDLDSFSLGDAFSYQGQKYILKKAQNVLLDFQNGESLIRTFDEEKTKVFEGQCLSDPKKYLYVEKRNDRPAPIVSKGESVEFSELKFQNLRPPDSHSRIQKMGCPNCSAYFLVRYKSFSLRAICNTCFSIIDISSDDHMSLSEFDRENRFEPTLPIGAQGKLLGDNFEVIGCIRLIGKHNNAITKYLLYSPTKSYRWLTDENAHWTISRVVLDLEKSSLTKKQIEYRGQLYSPDRSGELKLIFAIGEFYWPIQKLERFESDYFISAPYELNFEKNRDESNIYLGRYLSPHQVSSAFKLVKTLGRPKGSVPHEVSPFHHIVKEFLLINLVFILVCFFVQLRSVKLPGTIVHQSHVHLTQKSEDPLLSTEPFELRGVTSALSVAVTATFSAGIDFNLNAIRERSKYTFNTLPLNNRALVSRVPSGLYYLSFARNQLINSTSGEVKDFDVTVIYGAKSWSNFFLAAIMLSIPSFFIFGIDQLFEIKRRRKRIK